MSWGLLLLLLIATIIFAIMIMSIDEFLNSDEWQDEDDK